MFDIGVYIMITSVIPLRVYLWEKGAKIIYAPEDYYPFDPTTLSKYVLNGGKLPWIPSWEV